MKKIILFLCLSILMIVSAESQTLKDICNEEPLKEKILISPVIIGDIGDETYIASTNTKYSPDDKLKNLRLSKYNRESLKMTKTIAVKGFQSEREEGLLKNAIYETTILNHGSIYVFWHKNESKSNKFILQVFDKDLNEIQKPKIIYELPEKSNLYTQSQFFALFSPDGTKIIIGGEEQPVENENLKMQYKVFDSNFEVLYSNRTTLPFKVNYLSTPKKIACEYLMNNKGDLFFNSDILINDGSKTKKSGLLFGAVNSETGELNYKNIALENKKVTSVVYQTSNDTLTFHGTCVSQINKKNKYELFTFKTDAKYLEPLNEISFSNIDFDKIKYTDFKKAKGLQTIHERAGNLMTSKGLIISSFIETADGGLIFTLQSNIVDPWISPEDQQYITREPTGIHFLKLNNSNEIEWISSTQNHIQQNNKIEKDGDQYYTVLQNAVSEDYQIFKVDDRKVINDPKIIKNEYDGLLLHQVDDVFYYLKLKNKIKSGAKVGKIISIVFTPVLIGIMPLILFTLQKRHFVYFGNLKIKP
jgi:hypothetical protein